MAANMSAFGAAPTASTSNTGTANPFNSGIGALNPSGGTSTGTGFGTSTNTGFGTTTNTGFGAPATGTNTGGATGGTGFGMPTGTNMPRFTELGAPGQWNAGQTSFGAPAFVGPNNQYVVSDEIFWNPNTPMGADLQNLVKQVQAGGGQAGLTFSPYALYSPVNALGQPNTAPTIQQVLDEIKSSGVNFVALDPYLFGDNMFTPEQGVEWTRQAVQALKDIGVDPRIVTQSFAPTGMDPDVVRRYNAALASIPGISEATLFGLEDDPSMSRDRYYSLTDPYGFEAQAMRAAETANAPAVVDPALNVPANQPTAADITVPDTITAPTTPTTPTTPVAPVTTAAPDLVTTLEDIVTGGAAEPITPTTPTTPAAPLAPDLVTTLEDIVTGNVAAPPPPAAAPSTAPLANKPVTPPAAPVAQPKSPVAPVAPAPVAGKKELSPKVKAALEKSSLAKKELPIPKSKADLAKEAKKSSVQSGIINALESQGVTGKPASDVASLVMSGGGASPSKSALLNALTGGKASSKASPAQLQQVNKIAKALGIG